EKQIKKEKAQKRLQEILSIVKLYKDKGWVPPPGLISEAEDLALEYPELKVIVAEIISINEEAIQIISSQTGMSAAEIKAFEDSLEREPLKTISQYIDSREEDLDTIKTIMNGGRASPEQEANAIKNALSPKEQYKLNAINQKGGLILEEMRQKDEKTPDHTRLENDLEKAAHLKLHERVVEKHKAKRERDGLPADHTIIAREDGDSIAHDVHQVGNVINNNIEGGVKRLGALFANTAGDRIIDEFIEHKDTDKLKAQIEEAEKKNAAIVAARIAKEKEEAAIVAARIAKAKEAKAKTAREKAEKVKKGAESSETEKVDSQDENSTDKLPTRKAKQNNTHIDEVTSITTQNLPIISTKNNRQL
ncbi:MAG: hypothetical protein AABY27_06390, partial [Pseudomonadota bacterium]